MGQSSSKNCCVSVPSKPKCFPYFRDEQELVCATEKVAESVSTFRDCLTLFSSLVLDATQMSSTSFILTTTTVVLKFALDRLSNKNGNSSNEAKNGLEGALIQLKIDKAIAQSAVAGLQAKLVAINNRNSRLLLQNIPHEDRRLEVIPALSLCEEILQLFRDENHVFAKHPIVTAPFLLTFGGVYSMLSELSLTIIPSYRPTLVRQMQVLKSTLENYEQSCVMAREVNLRIKMRESSESMVGVGVEGVTELYLEDPFLKGSCAIEECSVYSQYGPFTKFEEEKEAFVQYGSQEEAMAGYKKILGDKFHEMFGQVLQTVSSFSGFCGSHARDFDDKANGNVNANNNSDFMKNENDLDAEAE